VILGRPDKGDGWALEELRCIGGDAAERVESARHGLTVLIDLYRRGMAEPIPLFLKTSHAYAATPTRIPPMRDAWKGNRWVTGERDDPHHLLAFDGPLTLDELQAEPPRGDETGPGWAAADSRFAVLALRLWQPIFEACGTDT
jgi:exodeoxyribonuclease V gamma subunit